ncbi:hypothetical protein FRC09_014812 [Ceratobasidium sp. 395]|nr:hypothetical protein FRC09_014812 [Ceratobasidium sp. 395]
MAPRSRNPNNLRASARGRISAGAASAPRRFVYIDAPEDPAARDMIDVDALPDETGLNAPANVINVDAVTDDAQLSASSREFAAFSGPAPPISQYRDVSNVEELVNSTFECGICQGQQLDLEARVLSCGHIFCVTDVDAWVRTYAAAFEDPPIKCPYKCSVTLKSELRRLETSAIQLLSQSDRVDLAKAKLAKLTAENLVLETTVQALRRQVEQQEVYVEELERACQCLAPTELFERMRIE